MSKQQGEKSSLKQFYFHRKVYIILQTVSACNPYPQINLPSGEGKTDPKEPNSYSTIGISVTELTGAEINHDLVCAFIEVSAVYRFCYKPNLAVLKILYVG